MEMQKTKQFAPLSETDLGKLIGQIKARGNKLQADIKTASINAVFQSLEHGRTNYAQDLLNAVPKSYQRGLVIFFEKYGRIKLVKDAKTKTESLVYDKEKAGVPKPDEGKADAYVSTINENPLQPKRVRKEVDVIEINHLARIQKFLKGEERGIQKAVDAINNGKEVKEDHTELVKRMQQTLHDYMVEFGLASPEVEAEEPDFDQIAADNAAKAKRIEELEAALAKAGGALPAKPEGEGNKQRRTIRKAA